MASTVLPNGIIIPEKFSRDWYADLYHNWQELDNLLGGGTPKDGTLTIQKNGTTVGTFSANQATDETINIEVPDVNNGTLTIQQNGTTVDTFTANSSSDKTVDITVPTKTSDLTNDSGFITEDNTKIPLAGSNQISGDLIPSTDGTVNFGSPSYQWNNAYIKSLTINGVACGDILTHNASEFVDISSDQTIGGNKRFKDIIIRNVGNFTAGEAPTAQTTCHVLRHTNNDSTYIANAIVSYMFTTGESMCELLQSPCIGSTARTWFRTNTDGSYSIYSYTKNGYLGTSSFRWKDVQTEKINGLNPGALSLPGDAYIDIDTTNYAWGSNFTFTPDYDGYCFLSIGSSGNSRLISLKTGRGEYYFSNQNNVFRFTFPVYKGILVTITTSSSGAESIIPAIRVFSCQGNV